MKQENVVVAESKETISCSKTLCTVNLKFKKDYLETREVFRCKKENSIVVCEVRKRPNSTHKQRQYSKGTI